MAEQGHWSAERVELLRTRWHDGYSASQIAYELNATFPVPTGETISRAAVIGKIHRIGLTRSPTATKRHATFPRSVKRENNPVFIPRIVENEKPPEAIGPLNDFPPVGCCRHTDNHPAIQDFRFCGHPVFVKEIKGHKVEMSECEYHYRRNHQKPQGFEAVPTTEGDRLAPDEKPVIAIPSWQRKARRTA